MKTHDLETLLKGNDYPGRGIVIGLSADGSKGLIGYFIMGRSVNSRNRVFAAQPDGGIITKAFDESKMVDPSLIIYAPVRVPDPATLVVTNGDQTDTICDYLAAGKTFEEALRTRTFEPDAPNFTPRISGIVRVLGGAMSYKLAILKSDCGCEGSAQRFFYEYPQPQAGVGHFLHTYMGDGSPLPSFEGEPERVVLPEGGEELCKVLWASLNQDNKVSLYTCEIDLATGERKTWIVNANQ